MDKQSIIGLVLIGVVLVVWMYFTAPQAPPVQDKKKDQTTQKVEETKDTTVQKAPVTKDTVKAEPNPFYEEGIAEEIITVETDLYKGEISNKGAGIKKYFLKNYSTWYSDDIPENSPYYKKWVQLIQKKSKSQLDLVFVTKDGKLINTGDTYFNKNKAGDYFKIKGKDSLVLKYTFKLNETVVISKIYTFYGDNYASKFEVELENMNQVVSGYNYNLLWNDGLNFVERNSVDEATYANASVFMGEEQVIVNSTGDKEKKEYSGVIDWFGVRNKYFGVILSPLQKIDDASIYIEGQHRNTMYGEREEYSLQYKIPFNNSNYQKNSFQFFFGPIEYDLLKSYEKNYQEFYDFGSFFGMKFITKPISEYILMPLFKFLHNFIPNYGLVIILFTLIIKLALNPLSKQSFKSMKKMSLLQPKIQELKEKYKNDPQRVQKETMALYSTYGINPMGGCLPMLLQMPILFALFTFFNVAVELRHQPFFLWIDNLSAPDVLFTLPFSFPLLGTNISGLALILGITMFLQQKMSIKDPSQKAMVYMMPVMFTIMFNSFASGLNLYYAMFNVFSIIQQYMINKSKKDSELIPVDKPKKPGFMQRMMEMAEQQQKNQQNIKKKK